MSDEPELNEIECSYCGATLYGDAVRCGKCGNYTDDLGPRARPDAPGDDGRKLSRFWVVCGWIVVIALVLPFFLIVIAWLGGRG